MVLFGNTEQKKVDKFVIFIVEDNKVYGRQLEFFIQSRFGEQVQVVLLPVAEVAEVKIENGEIPHLVIMDHFLNEKYDDAEQGFDVIKRLKREHPSISFILHSSQKSIEFALSIVSEGVCEYISKEDNGFYKIENAIKKLIK